MNQQTYWLKKDGSVWKFYSDANCTYEITNHTFDSPYNDETSYTFKIAEEDHTFYAAEPVKWLPVNDPSKPHFGTAPHLVTDTECELVDNNRYSHTTDKSCGFDLQVVHNSAPSSPIPIFSSIEDVDPTIVEKGDPGPDDPPIG